MQKYYNPEEIERVVKELHQIKTDFFHLSTCKLSHQPDAVYLDAILESRFADLAEICEEIRIIVDDYFKFY